MQRVENEIMEFGGGGGGGEIERISRDRKASASTKEG